MNTRTGFSKITVKDVNGTAWNTYLHSKDDTHALVWDRDGITLLTVHLSRIYFGWQS